MVTPCKDTLLGLDEGDALGYVASSGMWMKHKLLKVFYWKLDWD